MKHRRNKMSQRIKEQGGQGVNSNLHFTLFLAVMLLLFIVVGNNVAFAQAKVETKKPEVTSKPEAKKAEPAPLKFNVGDFTYTSVNRRDPFEPVALTSLKEAGKGASLKRGYELEELRLVGIMKAGNINIAMMEDMQGKGILFKKNDYLNKNLWIVDILADKVEFGYKIKGEIKTFTLDIPRKKEGT